MKIKYFFFIIIFISFINVHAKTDTLDNKFLPLKDFIILKFDLFIQKNIRRNGRVHTSNKHILGIHFRLVSR